MSRCHFHGRIISKTNGIVAISTCSGKERLTGMLITDEGISFLFPMTLKNVSNSQESKPHLLVQQSEDVADFCGISSQNLDDRLEVTEDIDMDTNRVKRETTSLGRKIIELAVFIDFALYKKISETSIVTARTATIRRVLNILNQNSPDDANGNVDKYLDTFCVWQKMKNAKEGAEGHWDHAIMMSGCNLNLICSLITILAGLEDRNGSWTKRSADQ
ncbi:zinc metalloproteinase-disintegrin-like MTP8 [Uloborus diversus]|uniref:zinc metalloproteinase-disintegrin-like MTP8 n=1 Tax=Uloborus diversus TaxID=327109 RepID=UPI002409B6CE|nr:zinc metalloproteinase-disintegrin-like MTP8 [Uloborus diversus]